MTFDRWYIKYKDGTEHKFFWFLHFIVAVFFAHLNDTVKTAGVEWGPLR